VNPYDWNFNNVPDSQLEACCWWEYARESKFIRETVARRHAWIKAGGTKEYPGSEEIDRNDQRITLATGVRSMVFLSGPDHLPKPWQSLDEREQKTRAEYVIDEKELFPVTPVKLGDYNFLKHMSERCESEAATQTPQREKWLADCQREFAPASVPEFIKQQCESILRQTDTKTREFLARGLLSWLTHRCNVKAPRLPWPPPEPIRPGHFYSSGETLLLEIDWRHHTDDAIAEHFRKWVRVNRPKSVPNPKRTGRTRTHDKRTALRDLGVMRLLNFCTVAGMKARCLDAAKHFDGWESKHWSAARKRALRNFRSLFPFLPEGELPVHAATKGGRAKL